MITLPWLSTATPCPLSSPVPPNCLNHDGVPCAESFNRKMSGIELFTLVTNPNPKSTVPVKYPSR